MAHFRKKVHAKTYFTKCTKCDLLDLHTLTLHGMWGSVKPESNIFMYFDKLFQV